MVWVTSASDFCWYWQCLGLTHTCCKEKHRSFSRV